MKNENIVTTTINGNITTNVITNPSNKLLALCRLLRMKKRLKIK